MKKLEQVTDKQRAMPEYTEGDLAFSLFTDVNKCPHKSQFKDKASAIEGAKRVSWMAGWYDAKYKAKWPHLFDADSPDYRADLEAREVAA